MKHLVLTILLSAVYISAQADNVPYLTFSANKSTSVYIEVENLEYSLNGSEWTTWTALNAENAINFGSENGDLQLRGKLSKGTNENTFVFKTDDENTEIQCSGDIRTLVDFENYSNANCSSAVFANLFEGCSYLVSAPELPATDLAPDCYSSMFEECTSLRVAPQLPATVLSNNCYAYMFAACSSLTEIPELPATTLATSCYQGMFCNCNNIETATALPATTLAKDCYRYMFYNCNSLKNIPEILPAIRLSERCYSYMFYGCSSIEIAPELPALTLTKEAYREMFSNCTSLSAIKMMATTISATNCLQWWVHNVAASGTFTKNSNAKWTTTGDNGVPKNWTIDYATGISQITNDEVESNEIYNINGQRSNASAKGIVIMNGEVSFVK